MKQRQATNTSSAPNHTPIAAQTIAELIALEDHFAAHNYRPIDLIVERAERVWLYDVKGTAYLDCIGGYSAVSQGHSHPRIMAALHEQAQRVALTSRALRNDRMPRFVQQLARLSGYDMALPMNTGAEAVETAIKLARRYGYRTKGIARDRAQVVCFANGFHGRTTTILSGSTTESYRQDFGPFTPGFLTVPYGDYDAFLSVVSGNTCAVIIEPIQGEGGIHVPPDGFMRRVRRLCREKRILFIADEIQTGFGRTGSRFACDHDGIRPDVLIVGKALSGGFYPISAILANRDLMTLFQPGDHGSTFGGNPLACAVGMAALDVIIDEDLTGRARFAGARIMRGLRAVKSNLVKEVRGRGLLIGVELTVPARQLLEALFARNVIAKETSHKVLRISPPLVINEEECEFLVKAFSESITSLDS